MSSHKRRKKQSKSDSKKRSSFDERVCDDLCEVLLQYLPFEDKFKLECVSKQFQRNVFKRQYELVMVNSLKKRLKNDCNRKRMAFIKTAFETIVKKCPNIKTISLMDYSSPLRKFNLLTKHKSFDSEYNKIVDIIIENCNHLQEFEVYVDKLSPKTIDNFCQKFATKLSSIRFIYSEKSFDKQLMTCLSNITDLSLNYNVFAPFGLSNVFDRQNQCLTKNVRRLSLNYHLNDLKLFETLIHTNPRLKILDIKCVNNNRDVLSLCQLLSRFPLLSDLTQLNLKIVILLKDSSFAESLILLAKKCPNLKKIRLPLIHFNDNDNSRGLVLEVIDSLKHFKNLKRIDLSVDCLFEYYERNVCTFFTAKQFRVCKELTHLSLSYNEVNDSFFKDIGALLPGLRSLHILNAKIGESTLEELAQLEYIEELAIEPIPNYSWRSKATLMAKLSDESIAQMYVKCPKLKSIIISNSLKYDSIFNF